VIAGGETQMDHAFRRKRDLSPHLGLAGDEAGINECRSNREVALLWLIADDT